MIELDCHRGLLPRYFLSYRQDGQLSKVVTPTRSTLTRRPYGRPCHTATAAAVDATAVTAIPVMEYLERLTAVLQDVVDGKDQFNGRGALGLRKLSQQHGQITAGPVTLANAAAVARFITAGFDEAHEPLGTSVGLRGEESAAVMSELCRWVGQGAPTQ